MTSSQNAMRLIGDVEYFGCGCYTVVDVETGEGRIHYVCDRHRALAWHVMKDAR